MVGMETGMKVRFCGENYMAIAEKSVGSWMDAAGKMHAGVLYLLAYTSLTDAKQTKLYM